MEKSRKDFTRSELETALNVLYWAYTKIEPQGEWFKFFNRIDALVKSKLYEAEKAADEKE